MSQKPVDFDEAIRELQDANPSAQARARLIAHLSPKSRRTFRPGAIAGLATCAVVAFMMWPRGATGMAFSQSAEQTAKVPRAHTVWYNGDKLSGESWFDGGKSSQYSLSRDGKVQIEIRNDGKRTFWFHRLESPFIDRPNAQQSATVKNVVPRPRGFDGSFGIGRIDEMLRRTNLKVVGQKTIETPEGTRVQYSIRFPAASPFLTIVLADPDTGLIRTIKNTGYEKGRSEIDYPESIPDSVFAMSGTKAKDYVLYDVDEIKRKLHPQMRKGLGTDKGTTLRAVYMDSYGSLWFYWTGMLPDGKMSRPIKVPGLALGQPYGMKAYTRDFHPKSGKFVPMLEGKRLAAMAFNLKKKIGDRLPTVMIPTEKGYATFHNVKIERIPYFYELGLS